MYRGLTITLLRDIPAFSIYFGSYYLLCNFTIAGSVEGEVESLPMLMLYGGSAGVMSWTFTYPQDTIKTRLQADGMGRCLYRGCWDCAAVIYRDSGVGGFFKGFSAALVRAFPTNGVTFATVTLFLRYMAHPTDR